MTKSKLLNLRYKIFHKFSPIYFFLLIPMFLNVFFTPSIPKELYFPECCAVSCSMPLYSYIFFRSGIPVSFPYCYHLICLSPFYTSLKSSVIVPPFLGSHIDPHELKGILCSVNFPVSTHL